MIEFVGLAYKKLAESHSGGYEWKKFNIQRYCARGRMTLCRRDGKPIGFLMARLAPSIFDRDLITLFQDLLYGEPGTRAVKYLMDEFVDFGRVNANHIVTCIGKETNIKERSLEKLGFQKLETLYRIEV